LIKFHPNKNHQLHHSFNYKNSTFSHTFLLLKLTFVLHVDEDQSVTDWNKKIILQDL